MNEDKKVGGGKWIPLLFNTRSGKHDNCEEYGTKAVSQMIDAALKTFNERLFERLSNFVAASMGHTIHVCPPSLIYSTFPADLLR